MDAEVKKKWIQALRSGKYRQGTQNLKRKLGKDELTEDGKEYAYCCLGVLCEVQGLKQKEHPTIPDRVLFGYNGLFASGSLLNEFRISVGIQSVIENNLICLNDQSKQTFDQIADYIDTHL